MELIRRSSRRRNVVVIAANGDGDSWGEMVKAADLRPAPANTPGQVLALVQGDPRATALLIVRSGWVVNEYTALLSAATSARLPVVLVSENAIGHNPLVTICRDRPQVEQALAELKENA